jgi:GNAT superfamily N-acetyltransferase
MLPSAFEDQSTCEDELGKVVASVGASGAVALADGEVVGYLLGAPKADPVWGPNVWVEAAGHAVEEPELIRDLYALAAARWVDEGRTAHYAVVPANDVAWIDAWSRLGFGQQHMHAIRESPAPHHQSPRHPSLTVRRAVRPDIPALAALEVSLPQHQSLSPVFSSSRVPTLESVIADWEEDFDDPAYATFVVEDAGVVLGSAVGCSIGKSRLHVGLARPDGAGFLGFAAVLPEHRGRGAGRALAEAVLGWCAETGYPGVVTDWRITNLLSSRAWPALGFRPTFVRMHRVIGY